MTERLVINDYCPTLYIVAKMINLITALIFVAITACCSMLLSYLNERRIKEKELMGNADFLLTEKLNEIKERQDDLFTDIDILKSAIVAARNGDKKELIYSMSRFIYLS